MMDFRELTPEEILEIENWKNCTIKVKKDFTINSFNEYRLVKKGTISHQSDSLNFYFLDSNGNEISENLATIMKNSEYFEKL